MDVYGRGFYRHDARTDEGVGQQSDCADQQEVSCRVLHGRTRKNGEIIEEKLFYDLVGLPKTDRRYVSVSLPLATSLFVAACFQYPTVKRCRTWVGRSSSSIIATA